MTTMTKANSRLSQQVHDFVRKDFSPRFGRRAQAFESEPTWRQMRDLGTELWLDSGDKEAISKVWTRDFSALTTNNTLLNQEIQTGRYDDLILEAVELLRGFPELSEAEQMLELAFILNATHALRLVEGFDAYVSVEEHTDLAHDVEGAVEYARRYYAICPERFYVKLPFTAAGLLATRRVRQEGIPVNHTLGFSARQNYVIARLARPNYVNVFLGRLNSFVADNGLGSGDYVGEKATLASQAALRGLRESLDIPTRQIGASFRTWEQFVNLAGIDVITAPPKVAGQLQQQGDRLPDLRSCLDQTYEPGVNADLDPKQVRLDSLWEVTDEVVACLDALEQEDLDALTPDTLVEFFKAQGCSDLLISWTDEQIATSQQEGKIPRLENWEKALASGTIGLDSVMNLAGLNSFIADQADMDRHVREIVKRAKR